jgi:hypothetical protein
VTRLAVVMLVAGAVWTVVRQAVKADLEDVTVWQWLARQLIYRAVQRLPRGQRARYREEWIRHQLDLPGRIPPLIHALGIYARAGSWGRTLRGAPTGTDAVKQRLRAAWQRLWSRPDPDPDPLATYVTQLQAETAHATAVALDAIVVVGDPAQTIGGRVTGWAPNKVWATSAGWRDGMMHLNDHDFVRWLGQQRQAFEDDLDRKVDEWRQDSGRFR